MFTTKPCDSFKNAYALLIKQPKSVSICTIYFSILEFWLSKGGSAEVKSFSGCKGSFSFVCAFRFAFLCSGLSELEFCSLACLVNLLRDFS